MTPFRARRLQRRQFLQTLCGLASGAFGAMLARAEDLPKNTSPRAIFRDPVEPDWDQRTTIKFGEREFGTGMRLHSNIVSPPGSRNEVHLLGQAGDPE